MATGRSRPLAEQRFSHSSPCGQTRPHVATRKLLSRMVVTAVRRLRLLTARMNFLMSTSARQPFWHGGSSHIRQRLASATAHCSLRAGKASSNETRRASGERYLLDMHDG